MWGDVRVAHYERYSIERNDQRVSRDKFKKRHCALRNSMIVSLRYFGAMKTIVFGLPIFIFKNLFDKRDKYRKLNILNTMFRKHIRENLKILAKSIRDAPYIYKNDKSSFKERQILQKNTRVMMVISYPDIRLKKEIESLVKNGYTVSVILWERGWPIQIDCCEVKRLKLKNAPFGNLKAALYFPIWWFFMSFELFKNDFDIVHAVNLDTFWISLIIAKIKRKPIVYDIFDFYADTVSFPILPMISKKIIARIDRFLMKFADAIIIADESRIEQLGKNVSGLIAVINNAPKKDILNNIVSDKNHKNKFIVFVDGNISKKRGIDKIILSIKDLEDIELVVMGYCGSYDYKSKLVNMSKDIRNVKLFLEGVPYEEIIKQKVNADLLIALYDPSIPNHKYASPNKLFEAMMCGKPIIVNDDTSMANIVRREKCGIVIPYGDISAIRNTIIKLKNDPRLCKKLGNNGRRAYKMKYNWEIMERRLLDVYELVRKKSSKTQGISLRKRRNF